MEDVLSKVVEKLKFIIVFLLVFSFFRELFGLYELFDEIFLCL